MHRPTRREFLAGADLSAAELAGCSWSEHTGTPTAAGWSLDAVRISDIESRVLSFGRTPAGELLVCSTGSDGGAVHRIRAAETTPK